MSLPFLTRRPTVPAKDGASWPHVVIVGGGFAGANAVLGLRDARVRVTLIDRNVYKTFQPLLYQVATAGLNPGDVTMFLRGLSLKVPNMRYRQGEVVGVDPERKVVTLNEGPGDQELSYDYLVMAGTQGMRGHRKSDRLLELIERMRLPTVFFTEGGGGLRVHRLRSYSLSGSKCGLRFSRKAARPSAKSALAKQVGWAVASKSITASALS